MTDEARATYDALTAARRVARALAADERTANPELWATWAARLALGATRLADLAWGVKPARGLLHEFYGELQRRVDAARPGAAA